MNSCDWTIINKCAWYNKAVVKIICTYATRELKAKLLSKMQRPTKRMDLTKDPLRLNRETVSYVCWAEPGLCAGVLGPAQSLALCEKVQCKGSNFYSDEGLNACLLIMSYLTSAALFPNCCFHKFSGYCRPVCILKWAEEKTATLREPEKRAGYLSKLATATIPLESTEFNHLLSNSSPTRRVT